MTKNVGGRPKKKGERCPCGIMLAETAKKRYHKCEFKENYHGHKDVDADRRNDSATQ